MWRVNHRSLDGTAASKNDHGAQMKRYTITLGATTTAGGKVTSASSNGRINGARIALEGDSIFCPACKSPGQIVCVEPRIPERWNGKRVALEDDLCLCGCVTAPRLVPNQSLRCQNLSSTVDKSNMADGRFGAAVDGAPKSSFDDRFILFDAETGEALSGIEYCIKRASGQLEFGTTDHLGHTHLLSAEALAEPIEIYL
jgi:uncharacterized Zn-binding protein involved in type VI secretion